MNTAYAYQRPDGIGPRVFAQSAMAFREELKLRQSVWVRARVKTALNAPEASRPASCPVRPLPTGP